MAMHSLSGVAIAGIAACVPSEVFNIADYIKFSEQEKKDFSKHVGIKSKRHSSNKLTSADLCYAAAEKLIGQLSWNKEDIGLIILVTQSGDYLLPSSAIILQDKLKLSKNTLAFDINLGCSGWVYGISVAGSMMKALKISKAILLAGETSVLADEDDKVAFPLMGDAGTATAMEFAKNDEMYFYLQSDGSGSDAIIAPESGSRFISESNTRKVNYFARLDTQKIMEFCLKNVAPSIHSLIEFSGKDVNDVDHFVFHQANKIINESLRKRLHIPPEKIPYSIEYFGNTSSASIPLTMVTQLQNKLRSHSLWMLCSGFGVGLSIGNVLLHTEKIACPDLIEI